ncbi:MAG TPA: nucleotidyltransferase family protein [Methylophilaceae bacterium]|nr:nucleotidyltransferase family protein [Methylophilaceae bacterium]
MKAMILAAGRGERMRPLTDVTPKPLLEVGGKPLIVWHLERLAEAGFRDVVINHAHLGAQIEARLGNGASWGLSIRYSAEAAALETAGGIANALSMLGPEAFMVVNGDTFTDIDFRALQQALQPGDDAHLVLVDNPPQHPGGDFAWHAGRVSSAGEPRLTFSGTGVYRPTLFDSVQPGDSARLAPLLHAAISAGKVSGTYHRGVWHDIGTPQRLQELDSELKAKRSKVKHGG